jgi:excisionase family DNA binding protein
MPPTSHTLSRTKAPNPTLPDAEAGPSNLLTTDEACRYLRLSRPTLERRRLAGEEPVYVRLGKRIYYRRADLEAWLAKSSSSRR